MAYENIAISTSNFCIGPQIGTVCTIDTSNPHTVLKIKTLGGATVIDLTLSSNIINSNPRIEYVGPRNLPGLIDGLMFFTFERVSSVTCIIKRWEVRVAYSELALKEEVVKYSTGDYYYNALDFAVEYHYRKFSQPNEYYNYLDMDSVENVKTGTKFFIGPSTDTSNLGATEIITVSHIIDYIGGKRVYLTSPLRYQYAIDDPITFYSNVYIFSYDGFAGDPSNGTLFKLDAYSWYVVGTNTNPVYKRVSASKWCPVIGCIASIMSTNMLFINPYDSYLNWKSMFLGNVEDDTISIFPVYDVAFDGISIYKLQRKITLKSDAGVKTTWEWTTFNYQEDTLLPYSSSIVTWLNKSIVTGYYVNTDIFARVRDQFHVGLRDVYVNFYKSGDPDSLFDPLSGAVTTDINGEATVNYRSGVTYNGHTNVTTKCTGSSSSTGSVYTWTSNNIISYATTNPIYHKIFQLKEKIGYIGSLSQRLPTKSTITSLWGKSFFTSPGGEWGSVINQPGTNFVGPNEVKNYLPMLYLGDGIQVDSPRGGNGYGFSTWDWYERYDISSNLFFIGNRISQQESVESEGKIICLTDFLVYDADDPGEGHGYAPYTTTKQFIGSGSLQLSQLMLSLHTHWIDNAPYSYLWTYVNIDQFVFVEDAIPKFWSEKNPVGTNIWIRLRPFAFSLDNDALRMWVREYSYQGDTGYYEVTEHISLANFDAGSGLLGIEVTFNPEYDFLHDSIIFVRIEVYDEALTPNFIYVEYWFKVTPDYKSPYLFNLSPDREDINVPVDTTIRFEIFDEGTGINIDSLECLLNSRLMNADYLVIEQTSIYHIKVTYTPPEDLYFDKDYKVTVKIQDTANNINRMNDSYTFFTSQSNGVLITDPTPGLCKRGMGRFQDVSAVVLAGGSGVDANTIRMQVFDKDVHPQIVPIIYRLA